MDLDSLYEDLALWEQDVSFPEGPWSLKLIGNQDGGGLLAEDESFWANEDFPLKETLNESWGSSLEIDDKSNRDDDPFAKWLDVRLDLSKLDEFINSPDFDEVLCDLDNSAIDILEEMEPSSHSNIQDEKCSSSSHIINEVVNSVSAGNDTTEEETASRSFTPLSLNSESVLFITIEPRDIEYSPSSLASPSNGDISNAEQPSTPCSVKSQEDAIVKNPEMVAQGPDVEFLIEVPVDPKEVMNTSGSEGASGSSSRSRRNARVSKSKTSLRRCRPTPYICTQMKGSHSWEDDSLSSSSWEEESCSPTGNKRERKRDQNRNAACRYRSKKRAEQSALDDEESALTARNKELSQKADQLSSEIGYLKGLMREMLISKGLIKK